MKVVLDTCILKLATLPNPKNAAALIYFLVRNRLIQAWVSPAILDEYSDVLKNDPEMVAKIVESFEACHPVVELSIIAHEPDNRFVECALMAEVDYLITVNTACGHFDQDRYGEVKVLTPGKFIHLPEVLDLLS